LILLYFTPDAADCHSADAALLIIIADFHAAALDYFRWLPRVRVHARV